MSSSSQAKKSKLSTNAENKSFVGQMATTMTKLLPKRFTKWFSTTPNANGSTQMAESTDSSTEDESTDVPLPPPAKRMRYNLPGPSSLYTIPETRSISTNTEPNESTDHLANRSTYNLESNVTAKPCEETLVMLNQIEKSHYNLQTSLPTTHQSSGKRKSLDISASLSQLNESYDREFGVLNEHKPFFRIGLAANSPFYRGNTKYGGTNNLYVNQPNIKSNKTTNINNSMNDNEATMSNSAKRIMDLLDDFSSPTIEARRIPQITGTSMTNNSNKSINVSTASKTHLAFQNNELYVPSIANVLKLKERSRLTKTTSVARQIIASQSSSSDMYQTSNKSGNSSMSEGKFTSKIRSRVTKPKQNNIEMEQIVTPVSLPTATLQIDKDNFPKFSFNISLPTASDRNHENDIPASQSREPKKNIGSSSESDLVSIEKHIIAMDAQVACTTVSTSFKFSSPVRICVDTAEDPTLPQKFALCSPERNVENIKQNKESIFGQTKINSENAETAKIQPEKEQEKQLVKKCIQCEGDLNKEQIKSEMCADCVKVKQPEPLPTIDTSTKWRCGDCWVDNGEEKDKCVCCGGKKPSKTKSNNASNDKNDRNDQKSKTIVVNKMSDNNKLNSTIPPSNITSVTPNSTLSHIVKQQSSKWECPNCMVRNENNTSKCICCEMEKPGTGNQLQNKSFNFGVSPNVSFKFGIDPKHNITSQENIKSAESMEPQEKQSETNNNVFFGNKIEFKSAETKSTEASLKATEPNKESIVAPKAKFSFGIPKDDSVNTLAPTSSAAPATFSFGVPKILDQSKNEQDDKTKLTPDVGLFGIKPTSSTLSPLNNNTLPILIKPFTMTQTATTTTTESVVLPQSTLSFSSNTLAPPAGLLKKQKSTAATETTTTLSNPIVSSAPSPSSSMSFYSNSNTAGGSQQNIFFNQNEKDTLATSSLFPKLDSTTTLFSKPESTTTTGLSLFSKPDSTTTTTAAPQPIASNSLIFSFGNNVTQNPQKTDEKSKFSFTFGSNKNDSPKLFSAPPPFGSAVEKFNMSYPNTIGSGLSGNNGISDTSLNNTMNTSTLNNNTISSNIMGNNGLGSSPIGGNIMGNNTMGSNTMSINTVGNNVLSNNIISNNPMNNNELSNNIGLTTGNPLAGLPCGTGTNIGGDSLSNTVNPVNPLMVGASSTSSVGGNIFNRVQKKDMWSASNAGGNNIFASSAAITSTVQKPTTFTFGGSTSFNTNSPVPAPAFGSVTPQPQPTQPAQAHQPSQPTPNIFGNASNNQPLFTNTVPNQPAQPNVFASPQPAVPSMGLFGASAFGSSNTSFENVSMNPAQAPTFNFGASNNQTNIFGFTQRPQMQQTTGVYNFGSPTGTSTPQVQFNMGSAPVAGRRVRKVIRRTTAR